MAKYRFSMLDHSLGVVGARPEVDMHISTSNSKLGIIPSFNLLPGVTCSREACARCLREGCYAVKNVFRCGYNVDKNSTLSAWSENTELAFNHLSDLYQRLREYFGEDWEYIGEDERTGYTVVYSPSINAYCIVNLFEEV